MNTQDEIKQRLEVAQLYEEMGQTAKAVTYYIAAAEIALKGRLFTLGQEFLNKVLALDSSNEKAKNYLQRLQQHLASVDGGAGGSPGAQPTAGQSPAAAQAPSLSGKLTVPTPALYLRSDQIGAILAQVSSAPNGKFFPYDPLPKIDQRAIEQKAQALEARREQERAKERTAVESAFGNRPRPEFRTGGGLLDQVKRSGRGSKKDSKPEEDDGGRKRGQRGGNQNLADRIARKIQGS